MSQTIYILGELFPSYKKQGSNHHRLYNRGTWRTSQRRSSQQQEIMAASDWKGAAVTGVPRLPGPLTTRTLDLQQVASGRHPSGGLPVLAPATTTTSTLQPTQTYCKLTTCTLHPSYKWWDREVGLQAQRKNKEGGTFEKKKVDEKVKQKRDSHNKRKSWKTDTNGEM